ncbi:MAG: glycosyltransferase family A protein [Luteolibacter sp.]
MDASIIIVTRNRAEDLKHTLQAMRHVVVPEGLKAEILVVDNGSSDETAAVVKSCEPGNIPVRYTIEPRPGQTHGRNRGLAETHGQMILFTDDDVRPPPDWLSGMCEPLAEGKADAASGGVRLAPTLQRPWMTSMHRSWLAATDWITKGAPQSMVGANMAFSREVLNKVPGFDSELGPGASGFCDDHLFAMQLSAAGCRIHDRTAFVIEHHFDPSRLTRASWLSAAEKRGASEAYVGHHWEHWGCRLGRVRLLLASRKLAAWRNNHPDRMTVEGCTEDELNLIYQLAMIKRHVEEHGRKRKYEFHGLVKLL